MEELYINFGQKENRHRPASVHLEALMGYSGEEPDEL
jgi:hypothetical protein